MTVSSCLPCLTFGDCHPRGWQRVFRRAVRQPHSDPRPCESRDPALPLESDSVPADANLRPPTPELGVALRIWRH